MIMPFVKTIFLALLKLCRAVPTSLTIFIVIMAMVSLSLTSSGYTASVEQKIAPEYLIKAAYLYKFIFFVQWPEEKQPSQKQDEYFTIGILGDDPFGVHFKPIAGKVVKAMNKKIAVKRLGSYRAGLDLKQCRLLYISPSEKNKIKRILDNTKGAAILTVSDIKGFVDLGGMINMVDNKGHIRWEINLASVRQQGLRVSSALIQSAVKVIRLPENKDNNQIIRKE